MLLGFARKLGQSPMPNEGVLVLITEISNGGPVVDFSLLPLHKVRSYAMWDTTIRVWSSYFLRGFQGLLYNLV